MFGLEITFWSTALLTSLETTVFILVEVPACPCVQLRAAPTRPSTRANQIKLPDDGLTAVTLFEFESNATLVWQSYGLETSIKVFKSVTKEVHLLLSVTMSEWPHYEPDQSCAHAIIVISIKSSVSINHVNGYQWVHR